MMTYFVRDDTTMELLDVVTARSKEEAWTRAAYEHGPEIVVYSSLQEELRSAEAQLGGDA